MPTIGKKPDEAVAYAVRLTEGINKTELLVKIGEEVEYSKTDVLAIFDTWKRSFDLVEGGYNRIPKFPLPNNWQFMLRYAQLMNDDVAHTASRVTLQKWHLAEFMIR